MAAIVFGPPETADFNGEEHFDYVESFFRSLTGCDPNDVATILDSVIDEDDPHRVDPHLSGPRTGAPSPLPSRL
jgi:hypothetical protein